MTDTEVGILKRHFIADGCEWIYEELRMIIVSGKNDS